MEVFPDLSFLSPEQKQDLIYVALMAKHLTREEAIEKIKLVNRRDVENGIRYRYKIARKWGINP